MRKFYSFLVIIVGLNCLNAQDIIPIGTMQEVPCPFDPNTEITVSEGWEAYQTVTDSWDGIREEVCLNMEGEHAIQINFQEALSNRPVFVRRIPDPTNLIPLDSNMLYQLEWILFEEADQMDTTNTCNNSYCSGIIVGIQVPDETGLSTTTRFYETSFSLLDQNPFGSRLTTCFPTEYFEDGNFISEIIVKLQPISENATGSIEFCGGYLYDQYELFQLKEDILVDELIGNEYVKTLSHPFYGDMLIMHEIGAYPDENNITMIQVTPVPNSPQIETVRLIVNEYNHIEFQPFTSFQGGLIDGSLTDRHMLILENNGSEFCLPEVVELVFENGSQYKHNDGEIDFNNGSCFLFGQEGKLVVGENTTFKYGLGGEGFLALKTGGTIELLNGATLIIKNTVHLYEYDLDQGPQQIFMDLNVGSRLIFEKGSSLTNIWSKDGSMKLNVYMNGGRLDDSGLSAADKLLINRIYPQLENSFEDNINILNNPVIHQIDIRLNTEESIRTEISIINSNGQVVSRDLFNSDKGYNFYRLQKPEESGIYIVSIVQENNQASKKIVVY